MCRQGTVIMCDAIYTLIRILCVAIYHQIETRPMHHKAFKLITLRQMKVSKP